MDRSDFLKTLGFGGAALVTAPSFFSANKQRQRLNEVDKFEMLYKEQLKEFRKQQEKVWLYGRRTT